MSAVVDYSDSSGTDYLQGGVKFHSTTGQGHSVKPDDESFLREHQQDDTGFLGISDPVTLAVVCTATLMAVFVCLTILLFVWTKKGRRKSSHDSPFDSSEQSKITKSAPVSRTTSPKLNKRKSCPDSLSAIICKHDTETKSVKCEDLPNIIVTREHVQPGISCRTNGSDFVFGRHLRKQNHTGLNSLSAYHFHSFTDDNELQYQKSGRSRLWFSVLFDGDTEQLKVNLIKVVDLPGRNNNCSSRDPYVKIFLLPHEKTCLVSKVKRKTLNPVFNETHTFQVPAADVQKHAIRFSVYDVDRRRVRHSLGHAVINMKDLVLSRGDVVQAWLEPMIRRATTDGELQISLLYAPSYEKMFITIHNVRNLHHLEDFPGMGAYIRVQLFYGHKCHRVKQTVVHQGGPEMNFNETLTITVRTRLLETSNVKISLMLTSSKTCAANEIEFGKILIGSFLFAHGSELSHWQEMLSKPGMAITRWHSFICT